MPARPALTPVIHGRIERDAYTVERVYFASLPGHYVTGTLYRPTGKTGARPAVLSPYGHWPDGRFAWKTDAEVARELHSAAERDPVAARSPLQANCAMLARMGCVVFQYDMVGYCDSQSIPHREGFLDTGAILRLQSFMGLQTWNSLRALDFMLSLPEVDVNRVAVSGSSSGGTQTIALNAVDDRAAVAFPIVMVSMNMQGGCVCENAPLYRVGTNNVELAALFAPKPQGMAAAEDWTRDFLTRGLPEMKAVWRLFDAESRVFGAHINFGHNHNVHSRELQYAFLNEHLQLGWPKPVTEQPFEPIVPTELSVWSENHPLPADATDVAGVRAWMTRSAAEAMDAMDEPTRVAVVGDALRAMIVSDLPAAEDVEVVGAGAREPRLHAGVEWEGHLSRRGAGERVPCRIIAPRNWNGSIIVAALEGGAASVGRQNGDLQPLFEAGCAVAGIDHFGSGAFDRPAAPQPTTPPGQNPPYAGFLLGYERAIVAEQAHDILTLIALCRRLRAVGSTVHVLASGVPAVAALLARALAGDAVDRCALDLGGFHFDEIVDDADPRLLPGATKYGGVEGIAWLCTSGPMLIGGARFDPHRIRKNAVVRPASIEVIEMTAWLLASP